MTLRMLPGAFAVVCVMLLLLTPLAVRAYARGAAAATSAALDKGTTTTATNSVAEPGVLTMVSLGFLGLGEVVRRRRSA